MNPVQCSCVPKTLVSVKKLFGSKLCKEEYVVLSRYRLLIRIYASMIINAFSAAFSRTSAHERSHTDQ